MWISQRPCSSKFLKTVVFKKSLSSETGFLSSQLGTKKYLTLGKIVSLNMSIQEIQCGQKSNCRMSMKIKAANVDNQYYKYFALE